MKKFFNEYGGIAVIVLVIATLLVLVGNIKELDETTEKVKGTGVLSLVGNNISNEIKNFQNSFNGISGPNGELPISKTESQVGKYADIDGDGTVDGIIFVDLMVGGSGEWNPGNITFGTNNKSGKFSIAKISSCKNYYVSQPSYTNAVGGTAEVISPIGNGNDRFYIMALSNILSNYCDWYNDAYGNMSDFASATGQNFGMGKSNTNTIISKWNGEIYGKQNKCSDGHNDLWSLIQSKVNEGWFVPSRQEWAAFANNLKITHLNYSSKGLSAWYWSSSQNNLHEVYNIGFISGYVGSNRVNGYNYARLTTTF